MISVSLVDGQKKQNKKQTRLCPGEEETKQGRSYNFTDVTETTELVHNEQDLEQFHSEINAVQILLEYKASLALYIRS